MRDTSEYLELIGRLDAVILINWHLYTLERQIQNGSKVWRRRKNYTLKIFYKSSHIYI